MARVKARAVPDAAIDEYGLDLKVVLASGLAFELSGNKQARRVLAALSDL